jgi:predicted Fe-Mo cluster-binding NifX family protein
MKVCFAVQKDEGIESAVYGHFGSAPAFVVIDTEYQRIRSVTRI